MRIIEIEFIDHFQTFLQTRKSRFWKIKLAIERAPVTEAPPSWNTMQRIPRSDLP